MLYIEFSCNSIMRYVAAMPFFVHGNALVARVELHHSHGASNKTVCMQSYGACSRHRAALKGGSNRPLVWVCISSPHPTLLYLFFFFFTITRIIVVLVIFCKKKKAFNSEMIPFLYISMHILETTWSFVATSVDLIPIRYGRINQLPYAEIPTVYVPPIHIAWVFLFIGI